MTYRLQTSKGADAYLRRLDFATQRRIAARLRQVVAAPYGPHTKALQGAGRRRSARVGDYRVVYTVNDADRVVDVSAIGPRGQVYRDL